MAAPNTPNGIQKREQHQEEGEVPEGLADGVERHPVTGRNQTGVGLVPADRLGQCDGEECP
jgi:hypothetical protein